MKTSIMYTYKVRFLRYIKAWQKLRINRRKVMTVIVPSSYFTPPQTVEEVKSDDYRHPISLSP